MLSNTRIAVVDDNPEEVSGLLQALKQSGAWTVHFTEEELHEETFDYSELGFRFLFLDIELIEGLEDKNKAATLGNIVSKLVKPHSPYFIVFWTKHSNDINNVIRYLNAADLSPVAHLALEKPPTGSADVTNCLAQINTEISAENLQMFRYLIHLEKAMDVESSSFLNSFFSLAPANASLPEWSKGIEKRLGALSLSSSGKHELAPNPEEGVSEEQKEDVMHATLMLGQSYASTLMQKLKSADFDSVCLAQDNLNLKEIAELNSTLFIDNNPPQAPSLGNIFLADSDCRDALLNELGLKDDIKLCGMIISPPCDLANNKLLQTKSSQKIGYRVLYGCIIPLEDDSVTHKLSKTKYPSDVKTTVLEKFSECRNHNFLFKNITKLTSNKLPDAYYIIEPLSLQADAVPSAIVFHFSSITTEWWAEGDMPQFEFSLKQDLAFDIQSKMANHANRLGNNLISFAKKQEAPSTSPTDTTCETCRSHAPTN